MYIKTFYSDRDIFDFSKENLYQMLQEAPFINQIDLIKQGFYDKKNDFFLIKILDSIISIEIQLESDDYELMRNLSEIITEDNNKFGDTPTEDLFSFIRKISTRILRFINDI